VTVQTEFTSWQSNPKKPNPKKCSPICGSWWTYLRTHWGGQNLGCYVNRPVVGGTLPSSHGSGAALDWRYQNPGPGRSKMLAETMPWLINNSRELGIQAIHDYSGRRIWRPPSCSGRPATPSPDCGWKPSSGGQMKPGNYWLHLEVLPSRWYDTRTVAEMLGKPKPKPPTPKPPEPPTEGFLMALTDQQQKELYDRVMGSLPGSYSTEQRALDPPPEGRLFVMDNMDGNYLVQMIQHVAAQLDAIAARLEA
jgi:hypothetical protein